MNNSEEDIKQKIIMPFLKTLEFQNDELQFEKSFFIRLGRFTARIDTEEQIRTAQPRLDILVTRNALNLFVIEAKTDGKALTDEDRDQAISYARLVHPMAPLAVVTNGKEFKIFKVVDKNEIDKDKTRILGYKIDQDTEVIYSEAVEYFIGYSQENVQFFCEAQANKGMRTLLGSKEKRDRKFIPELYVHSKKLCKAIKDFLASDKPVFALIGESGSGKTCAMCGLSMSLNKDYAILFYRAVNLTEGITKSIANDFNWGTFSAYHNDITLFKRLDKMFKNKKVVIFIDGVDEWQLLNRVELLGDFATKIRNRIFKLVISCKSGQWENFLTKSGIPTTLSEEIFNPYEKFKGYLIEPFDEEEFHNLIEKYRAFYDFKGLFEKEVLDECRRSPFLLRVFFEVAHKTKCDHITFSMKEFYYEYYRVVVERIPDDRRKAENTIKVIAQVLFEKNVDAIDMDILRKELRLNINDEIMPSLFECNILEEIRSDLEIRIGFYFQKLRDYIIAFLVKKWDKITLIEFRGDYEKLDLKDVQLDALSFFYPFADFGKKKIIDKPISTNAEAYLQFYTDVLDSHFSNLRHRFSPETKGLIGFIGEFSNKKRVIGMYGFRPIEKADETVKLIPNESSLWHSNNNLMYLMGAQTAHYRGSCNGFTAFDVKKEVLEGEIYEQLRKIVDNGVLNESENYCLTLEKILGIVVKMQSKLHGIKDRWRLSQYLPISIEKVEYGLRYQKAQNYFENRLVETKIKKGEIKQTWKGSIVSYSYSFEPSDWEVINAQAQEAASHMKEFDATDVNLREVEKVLKEALPTLRKRKTIIDETILPDADGRFGSIRWTSDYFSERTLALLTHRIYSLFLDEYKILIETNFPTLKNQFSLYSKMPVHYFVDMKDMKLRRGEFPPGIRIVKCFNEVTNKNEVTLCEIDQTVFIEKDEWLFAYNDKKYKVFGQEYTDLFLYYPIKLNINIPSEFMILRNLVYKNIKKELSVVFEYLSRQYSVTTDKGFNSLNNS